MPGDARVRLLAASDLTDDVVAAWRDLVARAAEPNPCNEPDFLVPAMRHLRDGGRVRLLVVQRGTSLDLCLPVLPVRRWRGKVPVPALVAWTHDYQVLGTPLVDRDRAVEAWTAVLRAPWRARAGALLLDIEDLGTGGPVTAALHDAAAAVGGSVVTREHYERAVLARSDGGAAPSTSRLKRVRRSRRSLERAAGPVTVEDRSGEPGRCRRALPRAGGRRVEGPGRDGAALRPRGRRVLPRGLPAVRRRRAARAAEPRGGRRSRGDAGRAACG